MMTGTKVVDGLTFVLKTLMVLVYIFITVCLLYLMIAYKVNYGDVPSESHKFSVAFALMIGGIIFYAALTIASLVGLIISLFNRYSEKRKKHLIFFLLNVFIPALTELLLIFIWNNFIV